ncbi:hypothetical protein LCGC14_0793530 [marine sediment metagenome]|uniref:DUF1353 domain-containing protein n=1 Tax=marine sediment metagenome TaxID=412755 RepID=A0A0F9PW49_9ZZZZ
MIPQPDIRPIARRKYRLHDTYYVKHRGYKFVIRKGFIHDGASVPRFVWALCGLTPDGLLRAGALVHDALYRTGGQLKPEHDVFPDRVFNRKESDLIFHSMLSEAGVSPRRAYLAYVGIRAFGWASFKAKKQ